MLLNAEKSIEEIIIPEEKIIKRLEEIAKQVDEHYSKIDSQVILVGVLKGATYVMVDFSKRLKIDTVQDWMCLSSYGSGTKSSGVVRVIKDLTVDVKDKHVLIVEDIIDSGLTLSWLIENLEARGAASVEIFTLLKKDLNGAASVEIDAKWTGFTIPDKFVVGYGLDFSERFRNLPYIAVLKEEEYA